MLIVQGVLPPYYICLILKCGSSVGLNWRHFFLPERVCTHHFRGPRHPADLGTLHLSPKVLAYGRILGFSILTMLPTLGLVVLFKRCEPLVPICYHSLLLGLVSTHFSVICGDCWRFPPVIH